MFTDLFTAASADVALDRAKADLSSDRRLRSGIARHILVGRNPHKDVGADLDKPFEKIVQRVDQQRGLAAVTLGELRDLLNKGRLGRNVLKLIAEELANCGLGYFPLSTLENHGQPRAAEEIRVYLLETSLASLIEAVTRPSEDGDEVLRDSTGDTAAVVEEIRRLVA